MLTRIKIEKLFDIFDYDIELKPEGITILTGPNGYGKTTILKILDVLVLRNADFFNKLVFKKITLDFSSGNCVVLKKAQNGEILISNSSNNFITFDLVELNDPFLDDKHKSLYLEFFLNFHEVYFIREQRLLRPRPVKISNNSFLLINEKSGLLYPKEAENVSDEFDKTIEKYAKELRDILKETLAKSSEISQNLDSSFPRRLFNQEQGILENEFKQRFDKVKLILKALSEYKLSDIKEDSHPTYKQENSKALSVYIDDTEQKLAVFSDLLRKLTLFTNILNERRFTFKRIEISKEHGFKFTTDQGKPLALDGLSSGEQQEVVLLYELLFKVKSETLVLIDEPELSLHVAWQKQFIDDLLSIIELQKINVIIATHSPQIINNRWDLTVDLEENFQAQSVQCESI